MKVRVFIFWIFCCIAIFCLGLTFYWIAIVNMSLIVEVKQGKLQGKESTSVLTGQKYYTFSGIPFAKAPIEDLRFKDPQPYGKWEGIYDASYERDSCYQKNPSSQKWEGSEDCLYINIHTPQIPAEVKVPKAVMVHLHGGAFFFGSGSEKLYSADYLVPHDVILVTVNYRLHVLGFLNLGIPDNRGNAGLKDQSLALKWLKENIKQFGGDPNNTTIFGVSAGAASVHYHIISPLSKGLFQKAIMQSGLIFSWQKRAFDPKEKVKEFSKRLGFTGEDNQKLLEFLKKQPVKILVETYVNMAFELFELYSNAYCRAPFPPDVEAIKDGAFLPESPEELLKSAAPLPIICGLTNKDASMFVESFSEDVVANLKQDFSIILKNNFDIMPEKLAEISAQVKNYYLGDKEIGVETAEQLSNLFSDIMFFQIYESIDFATKSPISPYIYEFAYDRKKYSSENTTESSSKKPVLAKNFKGARHGDDITYLFYAKDSLTPPPTHSDDLTVIKHMTTMWTNFAKTGNPNNDPIVWKPSTSDEPCYLKIDTNLELKKGKLYGERLQFLKNVMKPVMIPN